MKNIIVLALIIGGFSSCESVNKAEKIATTFHEKLDAHEHDYILNNLIDDVSISEDGEDQWRNLLTEVSTWGEMTNREKSTGFNYKSNNGTSTVKVDYTFQCDLGLIYEAIVLVDRGSGYKILVISMNSDKSKVEEYTKDYK